MITKGMISLCEGVSINLENGPCCINIQKFELEISSEDNSIVLVTMHYTELYNLLEETVRWLFDIHCMNEARWNTFKAICSKDILAILEQNNCIKRTAGIVQISMNSCEHADIIPVRDGDVILGPERCNMFSILSELIDTDQVIRHSVAFHTLCSNMQQ